MLRDPVIHQLSDNLTVWQRYNPAVKADLFATSLATVAGTYFIDPTPLPTGAREAQLRGGKCAGIIVTNGNHARAALDFATHFGAPLYAHPEAEADLAGAEVTTLNDGQTLAPELRVLAVEGAAAGEIALYCPEDGGTLILGDALINMESLGFTFLPAKYCANQKLMRRSLRRLLDFPCERILFAHGTPIVTRADQRLATLLNADS